MKCTRKETSFPPLDDGIGTVHPEKKATPPLPIYSPLLLSRLNHSCPSAVVWHQNAGANSSQTSSRIFTDDRPIVRGSVFQKQTESIWTKRVCLLLVSAVSSTGWNRVNSSPVKNQGLPLPGHFPQQTSVSLPLLLQPDGPRRRNCSCRLVYLQVFDSRVYILRIISSFHIPTKYPFFSCVFWLHFRLSKPFSMHESHAGPPGTVHPLASGFQSHASPSWLIACHFVRKSNFPVWANGWNFRTILIFPGRLSSCFPSQIGVLLGFDHLDVLLSDQCRHLYLYVWTLCWCVRWLAG